MKYKNFITSKKKILRDQEILLLNTVACVIFGITDQFIGLYTVRVLFYNFLIFNMYMPL